MDHRRVLYGFIMEVGSDFFRRHRHYQARERFDIRLLLQSKERGVRAIWRRERKLVRGLRGKEVLGFHAGVSIRKLGIP